MLIAKSFGDPQLPPLYVRQVVSYNPFLDLFDVRDDAGLIGCELTAAQVSYVARHRGYRIVAIAESTQPAPARADQT